MNNPEYMQIWMSVVAFLIAGSVHEFAHAYTAFYFGDATAKNEGRMTLNPIAHIDLIGTILLPAMLALSGTGLLFGWMKPVPVSVYNLDKPRVHISLVSFAGPFSNLLQFCIAFLIFLILFNFGFDDKNSPYVMIFIYIFMKINLILFAFNMIPIFPLDGGGIIEPWLPEFLQEFYAKVKKFGFFILLFLVYTNLLNGYFKLFLDDFYHYYMNNITTIPLAISISAAMLLIFLYPMLDFKRKTGTFRDINKPLNKPAIKPAFKLAFKQRTISVQRGKKQKTKSEAVNKEKLLTYKTSLSQNNISTEQNKFIRSKQEDWTKVNLCALEEYKGEDEFCLNCEWYYNCLENKLKSIDKWD